MLYRSLIKPLYHSSSLNANFSFVLIFWKESQENKMNLAAEPYRFSKNDVSVNKVRQSAITKGFVQRDCAVIQCYFFKQLMENQK